MAECFILGCSTLWSKKKYFSLESVPGSLNTLTPLGFHSFFRGSFGNNNSQGCVISSKHLPCRDLVISKIYWKFQVNNLSRIEVNLTMKFREMTCNSWQLICINTEWIILKFSVFFTFQFNIWACWIIQHFEPFLGVFYQLTSGKIVKFPSYFYYINILATETTHITLKQFFRKRPVFKHYSLSWFWAFFK